MTGIRWKNFRLKTWPQAQEDKSWFCIFARSYCDCFCENWQLKDLTLFVVIFRRFLVFPPFDHCANSSSIFWFLASLGEVSLLFWLGTRKLHQGQGRKKVWKSGWDGVCVGRGSLVKRNNAMGTICSLDWDWVDWSATIYPLVMSTSWAGSSHSSSWGIFSSAWLGLARDLFHFSLKSKIWPKMSQNLNLSFHNKLILKMTKLCS